MNNKNYFLDFIKKPYFSKKTFFLSKKNNTLVFKFNSNINKLNISYIIKKIFNVKIKKIRTLLVKEIIKSKNNKNKRIKIWKKAYIILKKDQNININKLN